MHSYNTTYENHPSLKRSSIKSTYNGTLIDIPVSSEKVVWKVLVFMFVFFSGVFVFMVYHTWKIAIELPIGFAIVFLIFYLVFTGALWMVLLMIKYFLLGKETLEMSKYTCQLTSPGLLGNQNKNFEVGKIKNIRIELDPYIPMTQRQKSKSDTPQKGTIRWEYDSVEFTFGLGLPEEEARYLLTYLSRKQYLKSEQFLVS